MAEESKRGRHAAQKPKKKRRGLKIALISMAALLVVVIASGAMLLNRIQNPQALFTPAPVVKTPTPSTLPGDLDENSATTSDTLAQEDDGAATPEPTDEPSPELEFDADRVNILLLGQDSSNERIAAGMNFRTDSMILASFNLKTYEVDLISIPRDSYVRINGGSQRTKVNAAFVYGGGSEKDGYQYAMDTVSWVFGGIRIDYYVGYGMQAVKDVVDAMGGIEYDVDIAFTMNGRRTEKGLQMLDGQKALDYARYRGSGNGDIDRVDRQQRVIFAMYEQMKSTDQIQNIPAIYEAVMDQIDTNLDIMQIASLAYWGRNLDMNKMNRYTLDGYNLMIGNTYYYILDQSKKKELVSEVFGVDITIPDGEDYSTIRAMAQERADRVNRLMSLVSHVQQCIDSGSLTDPSAQSAVTAGQAALISDKDAQIKDAIAMLEPYSGYQVAASTPEPSGGGVFDISGGTLGGGGGDDGGSSSLGGGGSGESGGGGLGGN